MAVLVSQSNVEPVSIAEIKQWAKVEHDDEDGVLSALITSCRHELEMWLKRALITQTWQAYYDVIDGAVYAPLIPVASVDIMVDDTTPNTDFKLNPSTGQVRSKSRIEGADIDGVRVTYNMVITVINPTIKTALLELISYRFYNRGNLESARIPASIEAMVGCFRVRSL